MPTWTISENSCATSRPSLRISSTANRWRRKSWSRYRRSQNQSFLGTSRRLDALQNARFALSQVERELRTTGAGVPGSQPMLVYGDIGVVAINADYVERDTSGVRWAVYANPNATDAATEAWAVGDAGLIPTTTYTYPSVTYLQANGTPSPAETHMFWLEADTATARGDDYILWERVNSQPRDLVSRMNFALGLTSDRIPGVQTDWTQLLGQPVAGIERAAMAQDDRAAAKEAKLERLLLGQAVSDRTRSTVLQQFQNQGMQQQAERDFPIRANDFEPMEKVLNPAAVPQATRPPLDREAAMIAGLLLGSPEFQRR